VHFLFSKELCLDMRADVFVSMVRRAHAHNRWLTTMDDGVQASPSPGAVSSGAASGSSLSPAASLEARIKAALSVHSVVSRSRRCRRGRFSVTLPVAVVVVASR
jgi:hypothetical protein